MLCGRVFGQIWGDLAMGRRRGGRRGNVQSPLLELLDEFERGNCVLRDKGLTALLDFCCFRHDVGILRQSA